MRVENKTYRDREDYCRTFYAYCFRASKRRWESCVRKQKNRQADYDVTNAGAETFLRSRPVRKTQLVHGLVVRGENRLPSHDNNGVIVVITLSMAFFSILLFRSVRAAFEIHSYCTRYYTRVQYTRNTPAFGPWEARAITAVARHRGGVLLHARQLSRKRGRRTAPVTG